MSATAGGGGASGGPQVCSTGSQIHHTNLLSFFFKNILKSITRFNVPNFVLFGIARPGSTWVLQSCIRVNCFGYSECYLKVQIRIIKLSCSCKLLWYQGQVRLKLSCSRQLNCCIRVSCSCWNESSFVLDWQTLINNSRFIHSFTLFDNLRIFCR